MTALLVLIKGKCLKTEICAEELVGMSLGRVEWDMERDPLCQIRADNACSKLGWQCYSVEQVVRGQLWLRLPCKPSASPTSRAANEALPTA